MLAHLLAQVPSLPSHDVGTNPKPYIAVAAVGFCIAVLGHISKSKTLIASGILIIFVATFFITINGAVNH